MAGLFTDLLEEAPAKKKGLFDDLLPTEPNKTKQVAQVEPNLGQPAPMDVSEEEPLKTEIRGDTAFPPVTPEMLKAAQEVVKTPYPEQPSQVIAVAERYPSRLERLLHPGAQVLPQLVGGVEEMIGTAGDLVRWASEVSPLGNTYRATKAYIKLRKLKDPKIPTEQKKKIAKEFLKDKDWLTDKATKWRKFWYEQAGKGWEAPDPAVMEAKWSEMPVTKVAATISRAAPNYLMAIALTVLTKNPKVGLMFISALAGAGAYGRQREKGTGIGMGNAVGLGTGAWEYVTEKVPFEAVFTPSKHLLLKMLKVGTLEAAQEFVQGIGENFLEYFGYTAKDLKSVPAAVKEGLKHALDGWVENVVAGAGLGVIGAGAVGKGTAPKARQIGRTAEQMKTEYKPRKMPAKPLVIPSEAETAAEAEIERPAGLPEHTYISKGLVKIESDIGEIRIPEANLTGEYGRDLETIFYYGNFQGDVEQPNLQRSLSVGDTIKYRNHTLMIMPYGWRDVTGLSDEAIEAIQESPNALPTAAEWRSAEKKLKDWEKQHRELAEKVIKAEKTPERHLTPQERELMIKDWRKFSEQRGYSKEEIETYQQYVDSVEEGKRLGVPEDEIMAIDREITKSIQPLPAEPQAKQAWEMTREEYLNPSDEELKTLPSDAARRRRMQPASHQMEIKNALKENKPVPRNVLEEYKAEKWAQDPLAKMEKPAKTKEIKHEKETIIEPTTSLEMDKRQAGTAIPEKGTGQLDPTNSKDALKIIGEHNSWLLSYEGRKESAFEGIPEKTEWDKEKKHDVVISYKYTPKQIEQAYRTVQKPIDSPMPDTQLFAMPGKEKQMRVLATKMAKVKGTVSKKYRRTSLRKPKILPKASVSPQDHIKSIYKAASKEPGRYAINGVKVEGDIIITTDGRRMFWAKGKWGKDGIYLDDKSLKKGLLGKPTKEDIKFPNWQDIVPDVSAEKPIYISADELEVVMARVRQAMVMTTEESRGILIIKNKNDVLGLGFAGADSITGHAEINVYEGGKILGAVNQSFFVDALKFHAVRGSKMIEFYFPDPKRPMFLKDAYNKTFTLTMPINYGEVPQEIQEAITPAKQPTPETKKEKALRQKKGFAYVEPVFKAHKTFMSVLEPSKAVERKHGKEVYAAVIKAIHNPEVGRLKFNQAELAGHDKTIEELGEWFNQFPDKDLKNLMASRGRPSSVEADLIKRDAIKNLSKELRTNKVFNAIQQIANFNYAYLQKVAGDDINKVADYFYGIYRDHKKVDRFLDYWRTTERFTKEKKFPTVADALAYGLELRSYNPVENLKSEYVAIAHLEGMNWLKDELMRTGKGKYIDDFASAPTEWEKINDPVFSGLLVEPDLAALINNLIATNKITQPRNLVAQSANTLRNVNNFLRTTKFIGSAFHLLSVAKQSVADSGYLGFLYKKTALRGFTIGFRKRDPIFRTAQYRDYIRHGGGHRYSVESEARKVFNQTVNQLNRNMGRAIRYGSIPLKIPTSFVNWMFNSYIPKVKYSKYLDHVAEQEKKLGRSLKSSEKIGIIKEQQNFYGMMNERLFGRSGTVTTLLRFYFMSPAYAEGNYRTMIKAATQWGFGKKGYNASRSRSNIINSWIITGTLATVGTMIMTGKPPKKPETLDDVRDLFKIDTGKLDNKDRRIMIDLMTYDKDYYQVAFDTLRLRPDKALGYSVKRIGGMKAPSADVIADLVLVSMGRAVYDWKGDRVVEITDPFLRKAMKYTVHELRKIEPIPVSVYKQSRRKGIDRTIAAVETLLGFRPTTSEADKREKQLLAKMYSLRGQREELSWWIGKSSDPRKLIQRYNKTVNDILESPYVPDKFKKEWSPKLLVDEEKAVLWKHFPASKKTYAEIKASLDKFSWKRDWDKPYTERRIDKGYEKVYQEHLVELRKRRQ